MQVSDFLNLDFTTVDPLEGLFNFRDNLIREGALVVRDNFKFWGILTPPDFIERPYKIAGDCLTEKPCLLNDQTIQEAVEFFKVRNYEVLPVLNKKQEFEGLLFKQELLQELNRRLNVQYQDLFSIAHDLKNPLENIQGISQILPQTSDNERGEALKHLTNSCRILNQMVEDLVEVGRMKVANQEFACEEVDLVPLFREVYDEFRTDEWFKGNKLNFHTNAERAMVYANPKQMKRLIRNLLMNAIKYTPAGNGIQVAIEGNSAAPVVKVSDEGVGLSSEEREKLLKGGSIKSEGGFNGENSSGFGFFIVRQIARAHNIALDIKSEKHQGTTVILQFPEIISQQKEHPVSDSSYQR